MGQVDLVRLRDGVGIDQEKRVFRVFMFYGFLNKL